MDVVTCSEAAVELGVTVRTIRRYVREGKLPAERAGRSVLIGKQAVAELAQSQVQEQERTEANARGQALFHAGGPAVGDGWRREACPSDRLLAQARIPR